jgi:hypothetical protein
LDAIQVLHQFVVADTNIFACCEVVDIVLMKHKARVNGENGVKGMLPKFFLCCVELLVFRTRI